MAFRDQTFIKNNDTLEKMEKALKSLLQIRPSNKKMAQELFKVQKGIAGEKRVAYQLSKSNIGMYIFHDINFKYKDLAAKVDFIVVTAKACYFVEVKNYTGNIDVTEDGSFVREFTHNGKVNLSGIDSPIRQVEAQMDVFTKIALSNEEKMKNILTGTRFANYFKTLVVFTGEETILKMNSAPDDIRSRVVRYDGLIRKIEQINSTQEYMLSPDKLKELSDFILSLDKTSDYDYEKYYSYKYSIPYEDNVDSVKSSVVSHHSNTYNQRRRLNIRALKITFAIFIVYFLLLGFGNLVNSVNNLLNDFGGNKFTSNQQKAISIAKTAFNKSGEDGFEIIHTSVCNEISNIFTESTFRCDRLPLEINFTSDEMTIYKDSWCYIIKFSEDGKRYTNLSREKVKCNGNPIGYMEWDENNIYYKKIGGYNKIREMAIYAYNNSDSVHIFLDENHIEERGGNSDSTYLMNVDMFFSALTGKGYALQSKSTNSTETNKVCESLYYLIDDIKNEMI